MTITCTKEYGTSNGGETDLGTTGYVIEDVHRLSWHNLSRIYLINVVTSFKITTSEFQDLVP